MQKIQDDRAIDVMQKYVDAAYAEASIRIASEKLNESKRMLAKMQRLYELGEKADRMWYRWNRRWRKMNTILRIRRMWQNRVCSP